MENNQIDVMSNLKSNFQAIEVGDYLSETQYYKVTSIVHGMNMKTGTVSVVNERGFTFDVSSGIVEEGMYSANQFHTTVEVTRTELIEKFTSIRDSIFSVNYHKLPTANSINEAIESANKGKILPIAELKKLVKNAYKGEERTLVGYIINTETGFGRSMVIDLEADKGNNPNHDGRIRQVDHRTLNWLIYQNVKYIVKK